jgi:hypothetical protein
MVASNPPADPPMPTIGQLKCFLAGFDFGFVLARFDCCDLVLLAFARERDALLFDLRFAAMAFLMLIGSRASYKLPFSSEHLHETEQASPSVRTKCVWSAMHLRITLLCQRHDADSREQARR